MPHQIRKTIAVIILTAFIATSVKAPVYAQIDPMLPLPTPGTMVHLSPHFTPAYLKGIVIHPENALKFDFIIYKGDKALTDIQKKEEYTKLTKYFLASLAIPDDDQWVNLSPYEKDRIIKDDFGKTEMGRDLLAQDYMLKQITASLIYPQDNLGKKFWDKVYSQAQTQFGTSNIPVNTFNKVWILPDNALIYEKGNTAYVIKNHLRVMLEEDYLSLQKHSGITSNVIPAKAGIQNQNDINTLGSKIVKQIVLPELEREVNEDQNFAAVRQVYSGMLLAAWYKRALKESLLSKIYSNKAKVKGIDQDPRTNEEIYRQYLKAYKKGVFNFIKEDVDRYTHETIPRKYFSGGEEGYGRAAKDLGVTTVIHTTSSKAELSGENFSNLDQATVATEEQVSDAAQSAEIRVEKDQPFSRVLITKYRHNLIRDKVVSIRQIVRIGNSYVMSGGGIFKEGYQDLDDFTVLVENGTLRVKPVTNVKIELINNQTFERDDNIGHHVFPRSDAAMAARRQKVKDVPTVRDLRSTERLKEAKAYVVNEILGPSNLLERAYVRALDANQLTVWALNRVGNFPNAKPQLDEIMEILTGDAAMAQADDRKTEFPLLHTLGPSGIPSLGKLIDDLSLLSFRKAMWGIDQQKDKRALRNYQKLQEVLLIKIEEYLNDNPIQTIRKFDRKQFKETMEKELENYFEPKILTSALEPIDIAINIIATVLYNVDSQLRTEMERQGLIDFIFSYDPIKNVLDFKPDNKSFKSGVMLAYILFNIVNSYDDDTIYGILNGIERSHSDLINLGNRDAFVLKHIMLRSRAERMRILESFRDKFGQRNISHMTSGEIIYIIDAMDAAMSIRVPGIDPLGDPTQRMELNRIKAHRVISLVFGVEFAKKSILERKNAIESMLASQVSTGGDFGGVILTLGKRKITTPILKFGLYKELGALAQTLAERIDNLKDQAMNADYGGIDFNAAHLNLQIKRDGQGVPLPISQQDLENIHIDGLIPVIINITSVLDSSIMADLKV